MTRYSHDHTQGPACAIAAGAATIYRNYFAPVDGQVGQTWDRQLDALAPMGEALSAKLSRPVSDLWTMRNGYALCTADGLEAISRLLTESTDEVRDELRGKLAIGLHRDVEVTDLRDDMRRLVSQAFCSALPVAYGRGLPSTWEAFARLVLEATYEATLLAAVEQSLAGGSSIVLLTRVGGGAFGNDDAWIDDAIVRAWRSLSMAGWTSDWSVMAECTRRRERSRSGSVVTARHGRTTRSYMRGGGAGAAAVDCRRLAFDAAAAKTAIVNASGRLLSGEYPVHVRPRKQRRSAERNILRPAFPEP